MTYGNAIVTVCFPAFQKVTGLGGSTSTNGYLQNEATWFMKIGLSRILTVHDMEWWLSFLFDFLSNSASHDSEANLSSIGIFFFHR